MQALLARAEPTMPRATLSAEAPLSCGGGNALEVLLVGDAAQPALAASICDWFRDEPWRLSIRSGTHLEPKASAAPNVVVALDSPERARLSIATADGRRWIHEVALAAGLDESGVEVVAQALHSAFDATRPAPASPPAPALPPAPAPPSTASRATPAEHPPSRSTTSDAPPVGAPRHPTEPLTVERPETARRSAADPASARRTADRPLPVHTGAGYRAYLRGAEPIAHGPALRIAVEWLPNGVPGLGSFFSAALLESARKRVNGLAIDSSNASLAAGVQLRTLGRPRVAQASLGAGVDLVALDVAVLDPDSLRLSSDRRARPRPFLLGELSGAWRQGSLELALTACARWQLLATHYRVRDEQTFVTLLRPWRLQPGLGVDAAYVW
jgi:hypothetical protein